MSSKRYFFTAALFSLISIPCFSSFASSEDTEDLNYISNNGFFNQGAVSDMSIPLEKTDQREMEYGPTKGFILKKKAEAEKALPPKEGAEKVKEQDNSKEPKKAEQAVPPGVDAQAFKLKQEFGDPKEEIFPKGVDSSPQPYKAMLKAFEMGRDDLALEYASAWIRYQDKLDQVVRKGAAMASVVRLDPENAAEEIPEDALTNIDPSALNSYFEKRKTEQEQSKAVVDIELDQKSQQAIKGFLGEKVVAPVKPEEDSAVLNDPFAKLFDSRMNIESRKALIRTTLAGKLPLEPTGNVEALFFMNPSEQIAINIGKEIAKVLASPTLAVSLKVVPLSIEGVTYQNNGDFMSKTGLTTLLRDGSALIRTLPIDKTPALFFVSSSTGKAFLKTGIADAVFIEEVANMIGGK